MKKKLSLSILGGAFLFASQTILAAGLPTLKFTGATDPKAAQVKLENGPLRADQKEVGIHVEMKSIAKVIEQFNKTERVSNNGEFYTEARGIKEVKLLLTFYFADGKSTQLDLPLDQSLDFDHVVKLDKIISSVSMTIAADKNLFKCFDPNSCVPAGISRRIPNLLGEVRVQTFDSILSCDGDQALIETKIGFTGTQRVTLKDKSISDYLQMKNIQEGKGAPATTGEEFLGFASTVEHYGFYFTEGAEAYRTAHVFIEDSGLKIRVETKPYFKCKYRSNESFYVSANPLGDFCRPPSHSGGYSYMEAYPGVNQAYSKDFFFHGCREL